MLELGLLRVETWSGSQVFRKKIFRLKIFGARPFSMMFFSPKFNYPDTSTHLSRGVMSVEEPIRGFLDTTVTHILFLESNHTTCSLLKNLSSFRDFYFPKFCLTFA